MGFQVGDYDPTRPLVIDPVLAYSTYLGGSDYDMGKGIAVDGAGNAYVTGRTWSDDFPAVNARYPKLWGDRDAFVFKLSADGQTVRYSTYLGGSDDDYGDGGIAVDGAGNAYVTGQTTSSDFPTVNAKYPGLRGWADAFVFKLSADGQTVRYSTYLGGSRWDSGWGIAVDGAGDAYVTGSTNSSDFPTVNAKYPKLRGGGDAFVFKLSADGQTVRYSSYLGGSDWDDGSGIAVDGTGNAYVTGGTGSNDFPTVNAKYPNRGGGEWDAFVFKLSADGQTVRYSTYLGGGSDDVGIDIAVDSAGNAHVTGSTYSNDFPTVNAQYPQWRRGLYDAFVFKLSADGQTVRYSTYLGGSYYDLGNGIAVDGAGNAYVMGTTESSDFPVVNAQYPKWRGGYDAFVFKLSADGQTVRYSTYLGGSRWDSGSNIAVDGAGNAYVTGFTQSSDFPTSATDPNIVSYDPTYNGNTDAFIAKFNDTGTLHPPLDNQSLSLMKGRVRGECVFGGYCVRKTAASAHNAIDYAVLAGTPVYAICDGKVKVARTQATTPVIDNRFTIIDHSKKCGYSSLWAYYGHIEATVMVGQAVKMGDKIGVIADWGSNSHLHLAINSSYKSNGWGYVNVGESTSKDCNETSVVRRRDLLANQGWIDPAILGASAGWKPFLLQGGASAGHCNAPTQRYIPAPMGKSLPYYPWKTP